MAPYTNQYRVDATFDETIDAVTDALSEEGFGVLADIDMQAAFQNKLDKEYARYRILAACNPPLAYDALDIEFELGALLPCNVVVYETDEGATGVSVVDPRELMSIVDNEDLEPIVEDVADRLEAALEAVPQARPVDDSAA
ncbi:DUF302 domain-containing protein [Halapricum desulfuricans]|uniref:DUF302 family n=1 Tax=Halapricum desulfuricans TaxID=2841257 RepID=A0A897NR41_9EURY|nr:DUF302 domain-containing protein [Halapricum desulfuricans]QSG15248.1 DUF302 family [Halapricum desulfuricans]